VRAVLDHIGVAVSDVAASLAFFRDALGLEVEAPEEVPSQRVRAHFVPVGSASLELLEATAPDSPIARFLEKRGPGLHHVTLRVDDLGAALERIKARGLRLIDEAPRPGAEGALVAFVHPASANGVLVELKQSPVASRESSVEIPLTVSRYPLGDLELVSLYDGVFRLDGGSMFGIVPKVLWDRRAPADGRNRIRLAMRPLVVRGTRTMLIDAGVGDKGDAKFRDIYGIDRERSLDAALAEAGLAPGDIDIVVATHLHFDHAGGFTVRDATGRLVPRFPRAQYIVRRGEWEDATHLHERNRGSYREDDYRPLAEAGVLQLVDEDATIMPGVRVTRTGGHTAHHQMVAIESRGQRAIYAADLVPTTAHLPPAWMMGLDLYPMETLAAKKALVQRAIQQELLVFFDHDPAVAAGRVVAIDGKPALKETTT
jgi:methylmalonyl-CoA epimerase